MVIAAKANTVKDLPSCFIQSRFRLMEIVLAVGHETRAKKERFWIGMWRPEPLATSLLFGR